MTQESQPAQPQPPAIQLGTAEYQIPPPSTAVCDSCHQPIEQQYYTVNQRVFCPRCRIRLGAYFTGGSGVARFFGATGLGLLAGLLGALLWFAVRSLTGYELGIIAIVVGLLVGGAVRKGSHARGGLRYQIFAVVLTYCCIVSQYMPDIFQEVFAHAREGQTAASAPATRPSEASSPAQAGRDSASSSARQQNDRPIGLSRALGDTVLLLIAVFIDALVLPVRYGFQNLSSMVGLLIIGFALYEAWRMNKRPVQNVEGPFALAQQAPAEPATPHGAAESGA